MSTPIIIVLCNLPKLRTPQRSAKRQDSKPPVGIRNWLEDYRSVSIRIRRKLVTSKHIVGFVGVILAFNAVSKAQAVTEEDLLMAAAYASPDN